MGARNDAKDGQAKLEAAERTLDMASPKLDVASQGLQVPDRSVEAPYQGLRRVLTYGTFDLLHYGHVRLLRRAAALGDYLVVALSTDEFNAGKGKKSYYPYETRREMLEAIRYVDLVIPERCWEQKADDVRNYGIDVCVMGADWAGSDRFEYLREYCDVVYLDRTPGISTTQVKANLNLG